MNKQLIYILNQYSDKEGSHFFHVINLLEEIASNNVNITLVIEKATAKPKFNSKNIKISRFEGEGYILENILLEENKEKNSRRLTQKVKDKVWNRDGGKCVQCSSNENLEFDHIIPHSKGGANTYRNIQLLCEPCNRSKSAKIG